MSEDKHYTASSKHTSNYIDNDDSENIIRSFGGAKRTTTEITDPNTDLNLRTRAQNIRASFGVKTTAQGTKKANLNNDVFTNIDNADTLCLLGYIWKNIVDSDNKITINLGNSKKRPTRGIAARLISSVNEDQLTDVEIADHCKKTDVDIIIVQKGLMYDNLKDICNNVDTLLKHENCWIFLRGYIDNNANIVSVGNKLIIRLIRTEILTKLLPLIPYPYIEGTDTDLQSKILKTTNNMVATVEWHDSNALDILGHLYGSKSHNKSWYVQENYAQMDTILRPGGNRELIVKHSFNYVKVLSDAVAPTKTRLSDSGYDLTLIRKISEVDGVFTYDTGIKVQPSFGFYLELVGRSSISKTGWMLANNIGIIDMSYTGNILVKLVRCIFGAAELQLPIKLVQLIPRMFIHLEANEVTELENTDRSEGSFGSTDNTDNIEAVIDVTTPSQETTTSVDKETNTDAQSCNVI